MSDNDLKNLKQQQGSNQQTTDPMSSSNATPANAHSVVPDNDEYYTLDLDRTPDDDEGKTNFDIASSNDDTSVAGSSSLYDGTVVAADAAEDDTPDYEEGGGKPKDQITDQNTTSSMVGNPGHWGIDEDTG